MKFWFLILIFLILNSCNFRKEELELIWIENIPKLFWEEEEKLPCCLASKSNRLIFTTSLISQERIPQNIYHYGLDTILISSYCFYNAVLLSQYDFNIESTKLMEYYRKYPNLIATNVYVKYNMNGFTKYYTKEIFGKKKVIYSIVANSDSPSSSFYINDYRIENPIYEINKLNNKLKPDNYIVFLFLDKTIDSNNKDFFHNIINSLYPKPQIIFTNINKKIKISKTNIIPLPSKTSTTKIIKTFGVTKIKTYPLKSELDYKKLQQLTELKNKTFNELNTNLLSVSKNLDERELGMLISKGIINFIFSDIVIIPNDIINSDIKSNKISYKDLYKIIKNPEDKLVYIKTSGEKIQDILQNFEKNSIIYINSKNIINEKPNFQKLKIYKITTTLDFIKKNDEIFNFIMEFSILNIKIKQPVIWYFKKLKKV
ncbi:MAG: hypothetical protein N2446_02495 [Elusimicrobiales bacterium]|nr:hypothetical protein [Elusimicrobiales bacterium]